MEAVGTPLTPNWNTPGVDASVPAYLATYPNGDESVHAKLSFSDGPSQCAIVTLYADGHSGYVIPDGVGC